MADKEFQDVSGFLDEFGPSWAHGMPDDDDDDDGLENFHGFDAFHDSESSGDQESIYPATTSPTDAAGTLATTLSMRNSQNGDSTHPQIPHINLIPGAVPQPIPRQESTSTAILTQMADQAGAYSGTINYASGMQSGMTSTYGHFQLSAASHPTYGYSQSATISHPPYGDSQNANSALNPAWEFDQGAVPHVQYGYNQTYLTLAEHLPNYTSLSSDQTYPRLPTPTLNNTPTTFNQTSAAGYDYNTSTNHLLPSAFEDMTAGP